MNNFTIEDFPAYPSRQRGYDPYNSANMTRRVQKCIAAGKALPKATQEQLRSIAEKLTAAGMADKFLDRLGWPVPRI